MDDLALLMLLEKFKKRLNKVDARTAERGAEGPQGPQGPQGKEGPKGPQGTQGKAGPKGSDGAKGSDGTKGSDGADGSEGIGIVDAYVAADGDLVFVLSNDSEVSVQMPLSTDESGQTIVYSQGGGSGDGGSMGQVDLPEMTSDPTKDTLVLRDGNANSKFNLITANAFTFTNQAEASNTADTWFLSGGETSKNGVKKNDAVGMRSSLDVYSKGEVNALSAGTVSAKVLVDAFGEIREALSNEKTVVGLKKALTTSLTGLIKTLETENQRC